MIKLKHLTPVALVLSFLGFQTYSLQAADRREISLIQPDDTKKGVELNLAEASSCNIGEKISIPLAVQERDEEVYQRFLKGVLIYRPDVKSDVGKIELPISALQNPLEGTFDLSQCGKVGNYISISTGYRKEKKAENANKVEIWFVPRFQIENDLQTTASHFREVFDNWSPTAPVGIFWTWGGWDNLTFMDHAMNQTMDELSDNNLYEKHGAAVVAWWLSPADHARSIHVALSSRNFHIHF